MWTVFKDSFRTTQQTLSVLVIKTNQLNFHKEIIAVRFEIHTKHT